METRELMETDELRDEMIRLRDHLHKIVNERFPDMQADLVEIKMGQARIEGSLVPLQDTWRAINANTITVGELNTRVTLHDGRLLALERVVWGAVGKILTAVLMAVLALVVYANFWKRP